MELLIKKVSRCAVIGHGSWATGIAKILTDNGERIGWYVRNGEVLTALQTEGRNPRYLSDVEFDRSLVKPSGDLDSVVSGADVVILATPSAYLKSFLEALTVPLADKFVISAIKGIVPGNYLTITDYLATQYGLALEQTGVIGGPSHAEEIALERLSYLTVACQNIANARIMSSKLAAPYIRTTVSGDIRGVEYAAILKNIYAISVGIAAGLGYGDNFMSVLISNGAREMAHFLGAAFPCERRDIGASAYLGDLLVTAYSPFSRNRRFGMMIGKGLHVKAAQMELGGVAEGYWAAETVRHVKSAHDIEMPIAQAVWDILYNGASPSKTMRGLTMRLI